MNENAEDLGYQRFFCPWWDNDEYQDDIRRGWAPEGFENYFQDMKLDYGLSENQLYWYWKKLLQFRLNLGYMQQEYPSCIDECFQASGGNVFDDMKAIENQEWFWEAFALTG